MLQQLPKHGGVLRSVVAKLNFFDATMSKPNDFRWTASKMHERPQNNLCPDTHEVKIRDLRSVSANDRAKLGLTLDKAGFEILQGWGAGHGSDIGRELDAGKWKDADWIEKTYKPYVRRSVNVFESRDESHSQVQII